MCSVIYVLLGVPRSTRLACSTAPPGARILRSLGGSKTGAEGSKIVPGGSGGAKTYVFLGHPSCAQARAAEGEAFSEKDEAFVGKGLSLCSPCGCTPGTGLYSRGLAGLSLCSRFGASGSGSVIYVLPGGPRSRRFACFTLPAGARTGLQRSWEPGAGRKIVPASLGRAGGT